MTKELASALRNICYESNSDGMNYWLHNLKGEMKESFEIENIIEKIALIFHENWRESRLNMDGTYKPMIEKAEDMEWVRKHWTRLVDITNTKFEDLPNNWKEENLEAAKVAVNLVYEKVINGEEITPEMIEEMSSIVHEKWLERNPREKDGKLGVPYSQLLENEKAKDRVQIEVAIRFIKSEK